jgi:hypothetical protein
VTQLTTADTGTNGHGTHDSVSSRRVRERRVVLEGVRVKMARRRLLVVFVSMFALVASAAPAGAATPSLKAQFVPLNAQIKKIGVDIGTSINAASNSTDVQLAKSFAALAQRAAASAGNVGTLKGATGANAITQRQLQLALAKGAIDLARIAVAAGAHDATKARAATLALVKDSKPITAARTKLAKALGISA